MWNLRKKLPKWTAVSFSNNHGREGERGGGGSKCSSAESLTPDSELAQEQSNALSVWKLVRYTGWHTGVLACAASAMVVLFINVSLTIYASTNPRYKMEGRVGTLYSGSCGKSKMIGRWLHLGINALSTLLLSGSNYTQQCLAAPTRSEIDAAHARRRWMDIGVPSIRNLFKIKRERRLLWIAIGFTSIPLHLLYNSTVYTSLSGNQYFITAVTNDHFEPGTYTNTSEAEISDFRDWSFNATTRKKYGDIGYQTNSSKIQLFSSALKGLNPSTQGYKDLTLLECSKVYRTDYVPNRRNLFLITNHSSNTTYNNTILAMTISDPGWPTPYSWICTQDVDGWCTPGKATANLTSGLPWRMKFETVGEVEIAGCKSEVTDEKCKVQFSLDIMILVICCNLIKVCSMIMTVVRSREPTLVTPGDAVDSFLRTPDPTTIGMCFADRQFIEREWRPEWGAGPRQWKQKGPQRWWTSVSKTRWITCNFFYLINIILVAVLLRFGIKADGKYRTTDLMWKTGLGKVNNVSMFPIHFQNITQAILLANLPQTILSFLYLTYNSLFTCMLSAHEWSLFSHHHRALRVTSPSPGQLSTYRLQIPYTYSIPLMILSCLFHWLLSQSFFLARVEISDPFGKEAPEPIIAVEYSCIAIIFLLTLSILALVTVAGMGYKQFAAEITTVGSCSAAISAACHASEADSEEIIGKKVRWGDVGIVSDLGVRHLTFSSKEGVKKPEFGEAYAGAVREGE
ncbi:hypothetical protein B9Z19DRAFT_994073 [Tuber borchii]|uniref:DUF6536 domain-containing protein n=1 Tax=Tuber borchii TaxID=42251 RepID=A0A2T6ZJA7_TUBBO|nr:hypothetical protein B9Z19DRAFT_994073 [Tuber borchii]